MYGRWLWRSPVSIGIYDIWIIWAFAFLLFNGLICKGDDWRKDLVSVWCLDCFWAFALRGIECILLFWWDSSLVHGFLVFFSAFGFSWWARSLSNTIWSCGIVWSCGIFPSAFLSKQQFPVFTAKKHGLDAVSPEVANIMSHATQNRLKDLISKLSTIAEHRMEIYKVDPRYEVVSDVRHKLKFLEELDRAEQKRHEEQEREMLLRAIKVNQWILKINVDYSLYESDCVSRSWRLLWFCHSMLWSALKMLGCYA